ncbi:MAG: hypothetical protein AAGG79_03170 [Pseudomonadota bacterium]
MLMRVFAQTALAFMFAAFAAAAVPAAAFFTEEPAAMGTDILSEEDEQLYRTIFTLQRAGKMKEADPLIEKVSDPVLLGYVLEQRYMHPSAYRSSYKELARWLNSYADHPAAPRVYRLALKRRPSGARPQKPVSRRWRTDDGIRLHPDLEEDYARMSSSRRAKVKRIEGRIRYLLAKDRPTQALNYLNDPRQFNLLTSRQTDRMRGWIAESFYLNGKLREALDLAEEAASRSGGSAIMASWTAGLIEWRRGHQNEAYTHFAAMADEPHQPSALRAGGAYWAARAALATGRGEEALLYLDIAAAYPLTLYGQLALGQLGRGSGIDWTPPVLSDSDLQRLLDESPRLVRASALAQVGLEEQASL